MKKPLDVRGKGTGEVNPGLAPVKGSALKKRMGKGIHKVGDGAFVHRDGKNADLHERWKGGKQHISTAKKLTVRDDSDSYSSRREYGKKHGSTRKVHMDKDIPM